MIVLFSLKHCKGTAVSFTFNYLLQLLSQPL